VISYATDCNTGWRWMDDDVRASEKRVELMMMRKSSKPYQLPVIKLRTTEIGTVGWS
jgi:hypothetical protein